MNSRKWLPVLMCITILVIATFQVYWLYDNYKREKSTMQIKASVAFRETVRELQSENLRIPGFSQGPVTRPEQILIRQDIRRRPSKSGRVGSGEAEVITMVNSFRKNLSKDSSEKVFIMTSDTNQMKSGRMSLKNFTDSGALNYLVMLDAMQDTIRPVVIMQSLKAYLKEEKLDIPFTVSKSIGHSEKGLADVTVGFANPATFHLHLGNTFPYLFKKLLWPLLFSFFIIAFTIFSFMLMYRNLLRQQKLAEIKNDFISNITHELKTPIATVGVAIEAMKNFNAMDDPARTKEYLDISSNELQRLGLLVDNVLKISLFEKKQINLVKEPIDLKQLVSEVLGTMGLQFRKYHAQVNLHATEDSLVIQGDKLHIMSVVYNLLDNALKYKQDKPVIDVKLTRANDQVVLQVEDNGIGIDPNYQSRIFEKFFRVPAGNNHDVKGYGLGLSYVSHIVEQHNGTIDVDSEVGKGSTFTIKLPA